VKAKAPKGRKIKAVRPETGWSNH